MSDDIHPGSFVGDSVEEFKKLPTWGKIAVGVGLLFVAYLGYRAWASGQGATAQQAADATASPAGSQSPFPSVGGLPLLPSNVNPVFDSAGNPIAYQQGGSSDTGGSSPSTPSGFAWPDALKGMKIWQGTKSHQFFYGATGPEPGRKGQTALASLFPTGTTFTSGSNGQLFYTVPGGTATLAPVSLSNPNPPAQKKTSGGHGGPGEGTTQNMMVNPAVYLQSAVPHLPSTVPH